MSSKSKLFFSNENSNTPIATKIEQEQQKLHQNEAKVKQLEHRRQQLAERAEELKERVAFMVEQIKKKKEEDNPVVKQLKEHFKALREELKNVNFQEEEQGDNIDIDNMSYEQLLELGETIGKVSKGLPSHKFQALEKFQYENELNLEEECTICRDEFAEGQLCVRLGCMHFFHRECLKSWLQVQKVCPNCKTEIK